MCAFKECRFLYIGLTQFRRRQLIHVDAPDALHRSTPRSNPLSYFERVQIIEASLLDVGIARDRFAFIPFPIEEPPELSDFLPNTIPIFTTTYDQWNAEKIQLLRQRGYIVHNLYSRQDKEVVGQEIRTLLQADDPRWRALVPTAAADLLEQWDIGARLRDLALADSGPGS